MKIINKIKCFLSGHKFSHKNLFNKEKRLFCKRCNKQFNTEHLYNIKCEISGKIVKVPLVKRNNLTCLVGYYGRIIKRHVKKYKVIYC